MKWKRFQLLSLILGLSVSLSSKAIEPDRSLGYSDVLRLTEAIQNYEERSLETEDTLKTLQDHRSTNAAQLFSRQQQAARSIIALIHLERYAPLMQAVGSSNPNQVVWSHVLLKRLIPLIQNSVLALKQEQSDVKTLEAEILQQTYLLRILSAKLEEKQKDFLLSLSKNNLFPRSFNDAALSVITEDVEAVPSIFYNLMPVEGKLLSLTARRRLGLASYTKGVTIQTSRGAEVIAPLAGTVVFSGRPLAGYQSIIIIAHEEGYHTVLVGMDTLHVRANQFVESGDIVGTMATRGSLTPYLYMELRHHHQVIDPKRWFFEKKKSNPSAFG